MATIPIGISDQELQAQDFEKVKSEARAFVLAAPELWNASFYKIFWGVGSLSPAESH